MFEALIRPEVYVRPSKRKKTGPRKTRMGNRKDIEYCAHCAKMFRADSSYSIMDFGGVQKKVHLKCVTESMVNGALFVLSQRVPKVQDV